MARDWIPPSGIATIYTLRRFYLFMRRTTISHFSFLISHSSEAFKRNQGTALLIPSHSFRTAKNIRGTLSAFTQMQAGHGIGAGVVKCSEVRTSWLSSVLGLAGGREAWKAWISRIFFVCLTCSALDRWGKKTDISLSCPMSRSAKQDLPSVRLLSVVFLSANEFWKSENSREKVHTRCPWLHVCIVYLVDENCKSRLISNSQVMGDR